MSSGVSLFALGALALAARSFHRRGEHRLTVIAKVTAQVVQDAPLAVIAPRPIVASERYLNGPVSSVQHPGDLGLRIPRAQILVVGSAYAERGAPTRTSTVRLAVARGESMLIDKRLEVVGDRRGPARTSGLGGAQVVEAASPFVRLPVVYERAFGGPGIARNPVGTGAHAGEDGQAALPNLHHANGRIAQDPPGFGPISSLWPARREMLGATPRQVADRDMDAQLEGDFPDAYFLAAPSDQQIDAWLGGEMIALFQMHPALPALRMHVPRMVVSSVLQTSRGVRVPVPMKLDTIFIEPDAMVAELTFRGDIRVDHEALRGARVGATLAAERVELPDLAARGPGTPADAFALGDVRGQAPSSPPERGPHRRSRDATLILEDPGAEAEAPRGTPFEPPRRARAGTMVMESAPPPGAGSSPPPGLVPSAPPPPTAFGHVDDPDDEAPATQVMGGEDPRRAPPPVEAPRRERAATISIELDDPPPVSLPFDRRVGALRPHAPVPAAPLPGAPWSPGEYKRPKPTGPGFDQTITDDDTAVDEPPPFVIAPAAVAKAPLPAPPPPPAAAAPPPAPKPDTSADETGKPKPLWREDPPEAPAPAPMPKAPRSRVSFKSDLYKKIKK